jgi:hypothetical protein
MRIIVHGLPVMALGIEEQTSRLTRQWLALYGGTRLDVIKAFVEGEGAIKEFMRRSFSLKNTGLSHGNGLLW